MASIAAGLLGFIIAYAIIQSRTTALIWRNITINQGKINTECSFKMDDFTWMLIVNMIARILSLGLLSPWAKMRELNYIVSHLSIVGEIDWQTFIQEEKDRVSATGEAFGDMADFDLGLG
ncbi:DUF898 family protein [Magnetococcales bacterium HHB-1]